VVAILRVVLLVTLAVIAGSIAFNAAAYAGAARHRRRHPPDCPLDDEEPGPWPPRALAWLRAFGVECAVTSFLALTVPLALRRQRIRRLADGDSRRPVVLLHGYAQHTANFLWLVRRLRRDGWLHLYTVRHSAIGGDIERSARRLGDAIDRIRRESGARDVDVIAHSMGGLVARAYLGVRGAESGIGRLITLGTPHQGTLALRWLGLDPMVAQMRPGSPVLRRLAAADAVPTLAECVAIYSADDALVVPASAAYYPGAFNVELRGLGHNSMLFSPRVYELVRENLAAAHEPARDGPGGRQAGAPGR
jgi:triacylglycerol esterase/lipase EstA (alpha/beta hydrolase family)